jgi:hypothetical protein
VLVVGFGDATHMSPLPLLRAGCAKYNAQA